MKFLVLLTVFFICGCTSVRIPENFSYREIQAGIFTLASWQKIEKPGRPVKIYIEGDGRAFNAYGIPSADPTPRGKFVRELAFNDPHENVVYLARPCQFINIPPCEQKYWTTGRFSTEVIEAAAAAIRTTAGQAPVTLVGFSGGAQVAALTAVLHPEINIKKIITVSGNLDHTAWTELHKVMPLKDSLDLNDYKEIFDRKNSVNYAGEKDRIVPPFLIRNFAGEKKTVTVPGASHSSYPGKVTEEIMSDI